MRLYDVNNQQYFDSHEFKSIIAFIGELKTTRADVLKSKYPEYVINHRNHTDDVTYYMRVRNVPYYDVLVETLLHKDGCGYFDIVEFTYQVNVFAKTSFHRIKWSEYDTRNVDTFLQGVWDDWKVYQPNNRFDLLEQQANEAFAGADLLAYHRDFIYNDRYQFVTVEEVRELFDQLVALGLLIKSYGDLYQVYSDLELAEANTDMKTRWHDGELSGLDKLHITSTYKAKTLPALGQLTSTFSIVPNNIEAFNGIWLQHKMGNKVWFIPQYLLFYKKQ